MTGFLGEYEVTMDAKGRFLVPAAFKKQLEGDGAHQFVVTRGMESYLTLYPMQTWQPIFANISKLNEFDPEAQLFRRIFLSGATPMSLDSAGRLLLTKSLIDHAGLTKDIVLASALNKIEIWDAAKYRASLQLPNGQHFSQLANKVMNPTDPKS